MVDPNARATQLEAFPEAIIIIILTLVPFSTLSVGIRTFVRLRDGGFGLDDGLLLAGLAAYLAMTGVATRAVWVGVGSKNDHLNAWMQSESQKFFIIWITVYVIAVAFIKSSVCFTLMRICAETRAVLRGFIWALLALTWASFCVTFFGILTFCRPVEANWNTYLVAEGKGECASPTTLIGISHTNTATSIVTDIGCIVLPGILLWEAQMSIKAKLQVFGLLSLASVASVTTIARAPFISHYNNPADNLTYYIGYILFLSCVETGIGCIAASLPSIRRLWKQTFGSETKVSSASGHSKNIVTIGGSSATCGRADRSRSHRMGVGAVFSHTDRGTTTATIGNGDGSWERLHDAEHSDKGLVMDSRNGANQIHAVYSYSVEMEPVGRH